MRDFEALRSEVYRRGEEKKTKRKRTRRVVTALCVPLALCITAVCFFPPIAEKNAGREDVLYREEDFNGGSSQLEAVMDTVLEADSYVCSVVLVEVRGSETVWVSRDENRILEISQALHAVTGIQEDAYTSVEDSKITSATLAPGSFQLTFTDRQGGRIVYLLTEEKLEIVGNNLHFAVTQQQYAQLKSLLVP